MAHFLLHCNNILPMFDPNVAVHEKLAKHIVAVAVGFL